MRVVRRQRDQGWERPHRPPQQTARLLRGCRAYTQAMTQTSRAHMKITVELASNAGKVCEYTESFDLETSQYPDHSEALATLVTEIGKFRSNAEHAARVAGLKDAAPMRMPGVVS